LRRSARAISFSAVKKAGEGEHRDTLRYSAGMDINKMLAELREERDGIEQAILVLQRLSAGHGKRRGRPPAWMSAMKDGTKRRGRPPGSKNKQEDEAA